jgi:hypothetical protein
VRVVAVVAARNEAGWVGTTVLAIQRIEAVHEVVVVDGASTDGTAGEARAAGARVLMGPRRGGKGGSLEGALSRIEPADVYLFLDADLGTTAVEGRVVLDEVVSGRADLAIGVLPRQSGHGGFRMVKGAARGLIRALSGFRAQEPLSGQRALTAAALTAVRPLAPGFGVEAAMTVDAARAGLRVAEVPVAMTHAITGRDPAGFVHRARQGRDLIRAVLPRAVRR